MILTLDFETRAPLDIKDAGLENYVTQAEPLCVAWALDDDEVTLFEFDGSRGSCALAIKLYENILDSRITKVAQNISFERMILRKIGLDTPIEQWIDTSVLARYAGLPSKLADICKALKLGERGKHEDGTRLINKFCKPKKDGTYRSKHTDPVDWQKFLDYCKQDVVAEREVFRRLQAFMLPERERRLWILDEKINRRGWPVDMQYVHGASRQAATEKRRLLAQLQSITGLPNPNSRDQFLKWAKAQGYEFNSLGKDFIARFEKMLEEDEKYDDGILQRKGSVCSSVVA